MVECYRLYWSLWSSGSMQLARTPCEMTILDNSGISWFLKEGGTPYLSTVGFWRLWFSMQIPVGKKWLKITKKLDAFWARKSGLNGNDFLCVTWRRDPNLGSFQNVWHSSLGCPTLILWLLGFRRFWSVVTDKKIRGRNNSCHKIRNERLVVK